MSSNNGEDIDNECKCNNCVCCEKLDTEEENECQCSDCYCDEVSVSYSNTENSTSSETEDETSSDDYIVNDDKHCILQGRWLYDNSNSIDEMIEILQREIALLTDLKNDGWVLQGKVMDDHAYLVKVDENE